jgi:hypothetical protein
MLIRDRFIHFNFSLSLFSDFVLFYDVRDDGRLTTNLTIYVIATILHNGRNKGSLSLCKLNI